MRKYLFSFIFGVLFSIPVFACLNGEEMILANQKMLYSDYESEVPYGHDFADKESLKVFLVSLEKGYQETKDLDFLSDKGFVLIILGKYEEAISLYKKIESLEPNRYSTASNIGTAYELIGNNTEALKWMEKAVKINKNSHFNSEWIHINILKAKIKGAQFINSKFLIGHDFGNEKSPTSDLNKDELYVLKKQIYYQLNERTSFVKPEDQIIANLLFDLGNIAYLLDEKNDAFEDYKLAAKYGFSNPILEERIHLCSTIKRLNAGGKIEKVIRFNTREPKVPQLIATLISIFTLLFAGLIVYRFREKIKLIMK
ncbi:tetratricopeptide repeat protein [Chryseobacterium sp. MYb264]|uniref:tetratricopeptide repeat protein n=1 Tax=Chryseobacterium sp. MYb264 TaxID=2745153 RepID=UPI002E126836|nr:tetratricopeptide repeat protein [Chryseobacterium sp. MYb264]